MTTETASTSTRLEPIVSRLRDAASGGKEVWRVEDDEGNYCIEFSYFDSMRPEGEAHEWLYRHQQDYPHKYEGMRVRRHIVRSQSQLLCEEAGDAIERLLAMLCEFAGYGEELWDREDFRDGYKKIGSGQLVDCRALLREFGITQFDG